MSPCTARAIQSPTSRHCSSQRHISPVRSTARCCSAARQTKPQPQWGRSGGCCRSKVHRWSQRPPWLAAEPHPNSPRRDPGPRVPRSARHLPGGLRGAHLGAPVQRINELIRGKRGVTPETAWLLASALDTTPECWINLQAAYDLARSRTAEPVERLAAVGRSRDASTGIEQNARR